MVAYSQYPSIKERIINGYRSGGLGLVLLRFVKKIGQRLFAYHVSYWYCRDMRAPFAEILPKVEAEIREAPLAAILEWEKKQGKGYFSIQDLREIESAKKYAHRYYALQEKEKCIGFIKVAFVAVYIKEYRCFLPIPEKDCFIYDTYLLAEYRGRSIAPFAVNEVMKKLGAAGYRKVGCHIRTDNSASQKAYEKIGFQKVAKITHVRFFGKKLFSLNPAKIF